MEDLARGCVLAGGNGQVGRLLLRPLIEANVHATVIDLAPAVSDWPAATFLIGDITRPGSELGNVLASADLVILALPEKPALQAIPRICRLLPAGALLVDTLSVKTHVVQALQEHGRHLEALSLNPMFAPKLGLAGRTIAMVPVAQGPKGAAFCHLLRSQGASLLELDAARHDQLCAGLQAAAHSAILAYGTALQSLGLDAAELSRFAPPPAQLLLAMVARLATGAPAVYWDIQAANPAAGAARAALQNAARMLNGLVEKNEEEQFFQSLDSLRGWLGGQAEPLAAFCQEIFEHRRDGGKSTED